MDSFVGWLLGWLVVCGLVGCLAATRLAVAHQGADTGATASNHLFRVLQPLTAYSGSGVW